MNSVAGSASLREDRRLAAVALFAGLAAMYLPVVWDAARGLWNSEEQAHGPLIVAVSAWRIWLQRKPLREAAGTGAGVPAWACLLVGAVLYALGRAQQIWMLQIGSAVPVVAGAVAALFGWRCVREMRFAVLFLVFAIPLPGAIVDELTAPLKRGVSIASVELLYQFGYPVARDGVVISLGQYQLLVADACSGLYSMTSLLALAVLYVHVARRAGVLRNAFLVLASIPFAFAANVMRVLLLGLITFHFGDAAGQGFLHGSAGIVMFLTAVACLFSTDWAIGALGRRIAAALRD